jgi:prolyl oligopeptidase PreP (S9A serine peptidase family)
MSKTKLTYPNTRNMNQIDDFHGIQVSDPNRWLKDINSPETLAWVKAQMAKITSSIAKVDCKTRIKAPMFLVHHADLIMDGQNPTLLYGYGGFGVSQAPVFAVSRLAWLEMGGLFAVAVLRGGGEY